MTGPLLRADARGAAGWSAGGSPLVSVVIPTYDGARHLGAAFDSVLRQSYVHLDIVVSDDGSQDATRELTAAVARTDARVRVLPVTARTGACGNWNRGLQAARGEYVKVLCQDDVLRPWAIGAQVEALRENPGAVLCTSPRRVIGAAGTVVVPRVPGGLPRGLHTRAAVLRRSLASGTNVVGEPSAVLFRRAAAAAVGGFRDRSYVIDVDLWLRLLTCGDAVATRTPAVDFRAHRDAWSHQLRAEQAEQVHACLAEAAATAGVATPRGLRRRTRRRSWARQALYWAAALS